MSEEDSCYSNDQQYFMDLCRGNQLQQLRQFINQMPENSQFNWGWCNYSSDNFMHMIAANNLTEVFDYLMPVLTKRCSREQITEILNKQNSTNSTPLHYAVVTNSKEMLLKLIEAGASTQIPNDLGRTPLQQAQKFEKFEMAEILAVHTKTDIEALKKQVGELKLNENDDSSEQQGEQLATIEQKVQQKNEQQGEQKTLEKKENTENLKIQNSEKEQTN